MFLKNKISHFNILPKNYLKSNLKRR